MRLLAFGLGYSARACVARLAPRLARAWGTTRDPRKRQAIAALGVTPIILDQTLDGDDLAAAIAEADHVLVSIAPDEAGDPVLNRWRDRLAEARPAAIAYLSTVGVYGDHGGDWVDEASDCRPVSKRSVQRVAAETDWQRFGKDSGIPVSVIRLSGIYGPGRGPFEKIRKGTARRVLRPGQVFNRIHVEDIAAIVEAAFDARAAGIFNGTDDEPAPPQEVLAFAADLLGLPPPPEVRFEDAEMTPMARSFYGENKRVRNERIKRDLGVALAHPDYRAGLKAVLAAERAASDATVTQVSDG